jgi:predicted transcriptional regulator
MTRESLRLADDFANGIIAKRIVELAKAGQRNPHLLCEGAIEQLREHLYGD